MERFFTIVKKYPLWIAGGVLAVVLLIWFSSGDDTSSGPVIVSTGPSEATVAANAMIEATRLENQRSGAANVAAVELAKINADSYAIALATSRDIREIDAEAAVSLATVNKDMNTSLASIVTGAQTTQTQLAVNAAAELATIEANRAGNLASISSTTYLSALTREGDVEMSLAALGYDRAGNAQSTSATVYNSMLSSIQGAPNLSNLIGGNNPININILDENKNATVGN